jgi:hypothetical protein
MLRFEMESKCRVLAINLEQVDALLLSLKTYWDYSNNKALLSAPVSREKSSTEHEHEVAYEL